MSIKGRPCTWFRLALRRGDLVGVRAAAAELGHTVNLVDALAVVLLMAVRDDEAFDRAATRWLARFALERPAVGLEDLRLGLSALEALPFNPRRRPARRSPSCASATASTTSSGC